MPAERLKNGRWSIGYVAGRGGTFQILLPDGADPSALTAAEIQAANDEAATKALGEPYKVEFVATSACEACPFGPGHVCRDEYQECIAPPKEPGEGVREVPPGYWVTKDWGWEWGTTDRPDQRIGMEMTEHEAIAACRGHRSARQTWNPIRSAPGSVDKPTRPGCPKCSKQPPDAPVGGGPCCNPACNCTWGTGCYHCHHPRFLEP